MKKNRLQTSVIADNRQTADGIFRLKLNCPAVAAAACPGEFVTLYSGVNTLRRPFSIASVTDQSIIIYYKLRGRGTEFLSGLKSGAELEVNGPLGNGFPDFCGKNILLAGGGIGIPPLFFYLTRYAEKNSFTACLGFRRSQEIYLENEFRNFTSRVRIITDDGSAGERGLVTDALTDEAASGKYQAIFACGPEKMLEAVQQISSGCNIPAWISCEAVMGCGMGICLGCAVKSTAGYNLVCADGPVFPAQAVQFTHG